MLVLLSDPGVDATGSLFEAAVFGSALGIAAFGLVGTPVHPGQFGVDAFHTLRIPVDVSNVKSYFNDGCKELGGPCTCPNTFPVR